ncbi:MAG: thioredoxin [Candidatus Woesearchaeota archaeon]|jgi:thioredoxin 1|nr:thioredoxin [Candidatus Woesearchaeota archaeon]
MTVKHITTMAEFQKEVLDSDKPTIVDFWAEWCGPCRMLGPIFEAVATERDDIVFVKVDVDEAQEIAGKYGIMSIPSILIIKEGEVVDQQMGAVPKDVLNSFIDKNIK